MSLEPTRGELTWCCGAGRWVECMSFARPFATVADAIKAGNECWARLGPKDWLEAVSHHPRIGEKVSGPAASEQAGAQSAAQIVKNQLAQVNRDYENTFGFIYIVCATGKSAEELLAIARSRLDNAADTELKIAAEEIRKIMNLRLEKLFNEHN